VQYSDAEALGPALARGSIGGLALMLFARSFVLGFVLVHFV
jgi:hypothetical protein